jgi:uncharacterized protein (DUF1499 family)
MMTLVALAAFVVGPILAHLGVVRPMVGFVIFALGGIGGLVAGIGALVALMRSRTLRPQQWAAAAIALFMVGKLGSSAGSPRINDFTTDPSDPPGFRHAASLPANAGRGMAYPAEFADQQKACCSDLRAAELATPLDAAFARARTTAAAMPSWTVTHEDAASGTIEAIATSWLFRFEDDIVIRVRASEGGKTRIDMRSKSRDGKGDMGANADRIRAYLAALATTH